MGRAKTTFPDLPPRMLCRQRGDKLNYYYATQDDPRKEIPLGNVLAYAMTEYAILTVDDDAITYRVPHKIASKLLVAVRKNAKTRGIEVCIDLLGMTELVNRAKGRCELTGIPFDFKPMEGQRVRPWIPSVDRIDSSKTYTIDNCRIVCAATNIALNQFGEGVLILIASGLLRKKSGRHIPSFAETDLI